MKAMSIPAIYASRTYTTNRKQRYLHKLIKILTRKERNNNQSDACRLRSTQLHFSASFLHLT